VEEVSQHLSIIKSMLCGTGDAEPQAELTAQLAQEVYNSNLLELLISNLAKIDFEVRFIAYRQFKMILANM
jgi:calcium binding protein 39